MKRHFLVRSLLLAVAFVATAAGGCALLDEQLEDCKEDFKITYTLRLHTNVRVLLQTRLTDKRDEALRNALEAHLKDVFAEYARDVDLSFYSADKEGRRIEHRSAMMEAGQATYEIELPARDYHHLALANLATEPQVRLTGEALRDEAMVVQAASAPVPSQSSGLFSARAPLTVHRDESETFDVDLYMVNCAAALVLHRDSCDFVTASCEILGVADRFLVSDSLFLFTDDCRVQAPRVAVDTTSTEFNWRKTPALFCGVCLPSRDAATKAEEEIWQMALYVTLADGTVTRNIISVVTPLTAGGLLVLRGWLHSDGGYEPEPVPDLVLGGVSITLDWKEGGQYNPSLG